MLVAIDVAKHRNEVLIEEPDRRRRRRRLTVLNTREEHDRLVAALQGYAGPVVAGFEATGNYHRPLAHRLLEAGFELRLISSFALARTREALPNGWDKNDPKDAQVILHMLRIGAVQLYHDPLAHGLVGHPGAVEDPRDGLARQDRALASAAHPLPAALFSRGRAVQGQRPQRLVPGLPRSVSDASLDHRAREGCLHRRGLGRCRAQGLQTACPLRYLRDGALPIGLPVASDSGAVAMFRMVLAEGRSLIRQRDEIERAGRADALGQPRLSAPEDDPRHRADQRADHPGRGRRPAALSPSSAVPEVLRPRSVDPPVGRRSAARPGSRSSATPGLRRAFWIASQIAVRQRDNSFRDKFERYIARDRTSPDLRRKALAAIAAKMARTAHAIIKRGVDYRPFFEGAGPGGRTPLCVGRRDAAAIS